MRGIQPRKKEELEFYQMYLYPVILDLIVPQERQKYRQMVVVRMVDLP